MNLSNHPCTLFVAMLLSKKTSKGAEVIEHSDESEFTELVSRGKLKHPPIDLYDLSQYTSFFFL